MREVGIFLEILWKQNESKARKKIKGRNRKSVLQREKAL
jgi:hypothetical protein